MKYSYFVLALVVFMAIVAACGNNGTENKVETGGDIFKQYCQTCHGGDGKLGLNGAKDLTVSALSIEQRLELITNGKGVMTPFRSILSPEQIRAVAEYTQTLK